ncbi:MAG: class I SAM-dependent methyltransferase [Bacillota bacterium]|nr:class I SAM-dependent methyltransferase [Bacillota bacterium]
MMKLSHRLQIIADKIRQSETMADIGTDHGFLPVYLVGKGICPWVVLTDVSPASLAKAEENCRRFLQDRGSAVGGCGMCEDTPEAADLKKYGFDLRAGDGLSVLTPGEVDVVVIAGMGGKLIRSILSQDPALTCSFRRFVFQPRIGQGALRKWLLDNGFSIVAEDLVWEGSHIAEIITAQRSSEISAGQPLITAGFEQISEGCCEDSVQLRIPPWIVNASGPVEEFLKRAIASEQKKLEGVMMAEKRDREREQQLCEDIYYLKGSLKEYVKAKEYRNGNQDEERNQIPYGSRNS